MWTTKAIFVPTTRMCECNLTNSLGPTSQKTSWVLVTFQKSVRPAPLGTADTQASQIEWHVKTGLMGCTRRDARSQHALARTACVVWQAWVLTRRTELVLHKKRKRQSHRSASSNENHLQSAWWQKARGPNRHLLNLWCWRTCLGRSVVWHCGSRALVSAACSRMGGQQTQHGS